MTNGNNAAEAVLRIATDRISMLQALHRNPEALRDEFWIIYGMLCSVRIALWQDQTNPDPDTDLADRLILAEQNLHAEWKRCHDLIATNRNGGEA